jgi:TonB family protein
MRTSFIVACILVLTPLALHAQESVAVARDLYTSANYEDALAVLSRLDSPANQPSDRMAINQYRAFCLLALGRMNEAERAIEAVLSVDLLYRPTDTSMSPRLRTAFAGVRQRMLPGIVQQEYARAKAAFERQDYPTAIAQFDRVLQALADPDLGVAAKSPSLADLGTLATGFRDLSVKAIAPPPVQAPPPAAAVATAATPSPIVRGIYSGTEGGVTAPVILRQVLPSFPRDLVSRRDGAGILEVVINEAGTVESATMRGPINPRYDQMVLAAAKTWKYEPAMVSGKPVKYRKLISISLKPTT